MRPHQWTKNLLCFAGAIFGYGLFKVSTTQAVLLDFYVFCIFCAASSAVYLINDIFDYERDRIHPAKQHRPIASGAISRPRAGILAVVLLAASVASAAHMGIPTLVCVIVYILNAAAYSMALKHIVLIDVQSVAIGFVLRMLAGVWCLNISATAWIVLCTYFLSLFLGFAKRRAELNSLGALSVSQRPVLKEYEVKYLDTLVSGFGVMTMISYALYTVASGRNPTLVITLPIVCYALMHYQRLVMVEDLGEEPDRILLKDPGIIISAVAWVLTYIVVEYFGIHLFLFR